MRKPRLSNLEKVMLLEGLERFMGTGELDSYSEKENDAFESVLDKIIKFFDLYDNFEDGYDFAPYSERWSAQ